MKQMVKSEIELHLPQLYGPCSCAYISNDLLLRRTLVIEQKPNVGRTDRSIDIQVKSYAPDE